MTKEEAQAAFAKLSYGPNDIIIMDGTQIDPDVCCDLRGPYPAPIVVARPRIGASVEDALRTCDLDTLKRAVAEMESAGR